jgi:ubiquinone/menaquinone biosynthesis C-methylase UbiE
MANTIGMGLQAGTQALRAGIYYGLSRAMSWQADRLELSSRHRVERPTPPMTEILAELGQLMLRDAQGVRDGLFPPTVDEPSVLDLVARIRGMLHDLPGSARRRQARDAGSVRGQAQTQGLPDYYAQDFHFQTGGYLTEQSARLYDVQVETLFLGGAAPMRREALRPIAQFMRGRDQRRARLLDVACGTGRFLRDVRLAYPALQLTGLDLSASYLDEARRHLGNLRPVGWLAANAEAIPLPDASQDIVTTIFLFHELPGEVRRRVAAEMARVLRPGGLLVFIDSLQMGDRPQWDGLLEGFPQRFHEPYYRHYAIDDLETLFSSTGLAVTDRWTSYFAKVMAARKA